MVTGSGFGASRLPQNLGTGQKAAPTATSWGRGGAYEIVEKMKGKLLDYSAGILHNNDKRHF
jgi:hypothetical protein